MAVTGFLSMWLANIATTAMMIPIAAAVLKELDSHRRQVRELKRQAAGGVQGELQTLFRMRSFAVEHSLEQTIA
jgi:di/tricarboxylate transporter